MLHQALVKASAFFFFCVFSRRTGTLESSNTIQIQECFVMAKKLKINFKQTQTIREAFADFLLQKKALGLADKTIETYFAFSAGKMNLSELARVCDLSRPTVYKYLKLIV